MKSAPMSEQIKGHPVVSPSEWLAARQALLREEKEYMRLGDKLSALRRELPWVKVEKDYRFQGPEGEVSLADLFDGRSQLFVQHFMFGPDWEEGCVGCSFTADHVDCARVHFQQRDLSFVAIARAPLEKLTAYQQRMGWTFRWVSSSGSDFNYDFGVSFTPEQIASGHIFYNYAMEEAEIEDLPGISVFHKDDQGNIFHTYSGYGRGMEVLDGVYMFLDLAPKGRDEAHLDNPTSWWRRHDRYETDGRSAPGLPVPAEKSSCCCA
ncbi:putative dithiol-disulfide oxidoreductase (DUF899 family) [Prosthecobacter fusiformis]|uniref:Putative dithiol-disulfide oxidoreductase (DUF899 family) n=1 Tax=Prosthecobacter fusiformis TaxID=48464 RepID=A0A4R7RZW2_9BACT|nr:thioredoxin family protein [Prosthecobacter fusiformis]TDU70648.1 putative dithiol-disulfide oxidoreductase (DUF899 family) [Prosthecobacter fusiformis]